MATSNSYRATQMQQDIYEQITNYIIEALENGEIIWQKPWHTHGLPRNVTGNIPYHGWNAFHLNFICLLKQYATPYFITFLQAKALGGSIRRGEKGHQI